MLQWHIYDMIYTIYKAQINAKILVMDLKYILNLISCLREEKIECKLQKLFSTKIAQGIN